VRSIEQQYWNLAQAHVQLWSADRAVELAREILVREEAELSVGRGTFADVAEASQRLEQFTLDWVTRTSDVITTERQLRNLLGLPPADNRRIIPVTPPTEARLEPDWDSSLAQMLSFQPDIVQQQILVRVAELQLLVARNQLLPQLSLNALYQFNGLGQQLDSAEAVMTGATLKALNPVIAAKERAAGLNANPGNYSNFITWQVGFTFQMPLGMRSPLANTRQAQYALLRSRAYLQQVVHQTTHSLARFFLEIDANYKQFKTASRLRAAAAQRLDAQRSYYEEGRITIDRFLDAVSQYATAVATEAQYKTTYNISIVALEEAKGTLLAYDNIAVAEGPYPRKAYIQARDIQAAHRQHHIPPDGTLVPHPPVGPANPDETAPKPPPDVEEPENLPPMPAPVGPLGPAPTPLPPHVPTATQPFLSQATPEPGLVRPVANSGPAATTGTGPAEAPTPARAPSDVTLTGGETLRGWAGPTASPLSRTFLPPASAPIRPPITVNPPGITPTPAPTRPPAMPGPSLSPIPGGTPAALHAPPQGPAPAGKPPAAQPGAADEFPPLPVSIDLPPLPPK
jgi:outer membrane protein TolC